MHACILMHRWRCRPVIHQFCFGSARERLPSLLQTFKTYIALFSTHIYIFYSQLNTSGRESSTCDTPVSHSIDIPTEELKVMQPLEPQLPPTLPAPTRKHIDKATNIIYTHTWTDTLIMKYQRRISATRGLVLTQCIHQSLKWNFIHNWTRLGRTLDLWHTSQSLYRHTHRVAKSNAIIGTSASSHTTRSDSQAHIYIYIYFFFLFLCFLFMAFLPLCVSLFVPMDSLNDFACLSSWWGCRCPWVTVHVSS